MFCSGTVLLGDFQIFTRCNPIYEKQVLPACEEISKNVMSVPSFPTLKDQEIEFICTSLLNLKKIGNEI